MRDKELIEKYIDGSLSKEGRHELEKRSLRDPMLMDAMEGHQIMEPDLSGGRSGKIALASLGLIGVFVGVAIMWWAVGFKKDLSSSEMNNQDGLIELSVNEEGSMPVQIEPELNGLLVPDTISVVYSPTSLESVGIETIIDESDWIGADTSLVNSNSIFEGVEEQGVFENVAVNQPKKVLNLGPYISQTINEQKLKKIKAEQNVEK